MILILRDRKSNATRTCSLFLCQSGNTYLQMELHLPNVLYVLALDGCAFETTLHANLLRALVFYPAWLFVTYEQSNLGSWHCIDCLTKHQYLVQLQHLSLLLEMDYVETYCMDFGILWKANGNPCIHWQPNHLNVFDVWVVSLFYCICICICPCALWKAETTKGFDIANCWPSRLLLDQSLFWSAPILLRAKCLAGAIIDNRPWCPCRQDISGSEVLIEDWLRLREFSWWERERVKAVFWSWL